MRVSLEKSFVLHTRPFGDTSVLLNVLSLNHGHLMLIAKGVRAQRSTLRAILSLFTPLLISWSGKFDLPTVSKVDLPETSCQLPGKALLSGLYINELLVRLLEKHNSYPNLFMAYEETLNALRNGKNIQHEIRIFEKKLLSELGYGLQLHKEHNGLDIKEYGKYHFEFGVGLKRIYQNFPTKNIFSGKSLLALHTEKLHTSEELQDAERLLQVAIQSLFGAKPIKSMGFL